MDVPFEQKWIDAGGISTRFARCGPAGAPAVLFLHGTAGSWEGFSANLRELSQHFECYAIDMIGSGFTDKPDHDYEIAHYVRHVADFMTAVGLQNSSLVGCSLGAWVAARFALTHPERTDKLVLLSAAGLFANASNMDRIRTRRTAAVENPVWENIKPIFDHLIHEEHNRIDDIVAVRQAVYKQPRMIETMQHVLCLQEPQIRQRNLLSEDEWKAISASALVVGSLADKDEYLETARRVSQLIPRAQYVEMERVGHWPHFEDPQRFNVLCRDFLR
ncbi:alpha/beta hydrolase [Comamonadaceae bacterium G21597-S1]|nr:alpha/beta hydrolase [Comamonadaceae bacterium G21597-S1]